MQTRSIRTPERILVGGYRPGLGAFASGICIGVNPATGVGQDSGDGSVCHAVVGTTGGYSAEEMAAQNASLNPGVAPITAADVIANSQVMQNWTMGGGPGPVNTLNSVAPVSSPITPTAGTNVISAPTGSSTVTQQSIAATANQGIAAGTNVGANATAASDSTDMTTYLLIGAAALALFMFMEKR